MTTVPPAGNQITNRHGTVWYGDRRVGTLRENDDRILRFAYDTSWLDNSGFPISIHLPLSNGDEGVTAHSFFEGLLPEGKVRQRICRQIGIAQEDDTGLLFAIGEDCAGALSILPAGVTPETEWEPPKQLTTKQINRLIRSPGEETAAFTGRNMRFSLAGAQEKQPVIFKGESYAHPDRANPSSHILKFETVRWVCFAECIANDMARLLDLPVAATAFLQEGLQEETVPYLRIERYDRVRDATGNLMRLHQEDLLQALGEPTIFKYQQDGGPSIKNIADVLREHTAWPINALAHLRDWQIFNYLIGNWDGHAKNIALLYAPDQAVPTLAPFYDLIAIEFLNLVRPGTWDRDMAFYIGEHHEPERITREDWEAFAKDLGMPPKRLFARLEELATCLPEVAGNAVQAFRDVHAMEVVYDRLEESVRRRCHWTLNSVFANRPVN